MNLPKQCREMFEVTPDETETEEPESLAGQCRGFVRKHLLQLDPHQNLFLRVPKLGLPSPFSKYLLYNMSLDDPF